MAKATRQIRLTPETEELVQKIADLESRSFSNCADWLLGQAARQYLSEHDENSFVADY